MFEFRRYRANFNESMQLLARFVIGSHLRSHPKFEGEQEEMTIGDSLDQDVSPSIAALLNARAFTFRALLIG
jgi:hypothetical protein